MRLVPPAFDLQELYHRSAGQTKHIIDRIAVAIHVLAPGVSSTGQLTASITSGQDESLRMAQGVGELAGTMRLGNGCPQ